MHKESDLDLKLDLRYSGSWADQNGIDFYDISQALQGFERVVSLTTHLLINGKVITQSPSAKGFRLVALPPEEGSWKLTVALTGAMGSSIMAFGTAAPDTAFGWLAKSAVEYVIQETLGFKPNFEETLGTQIENYRASPEGRRIDKDLSVDRFDSLLEKTESGVKAIHRPIVQSQSANVAGFGYRVGPRQGNLEVYADASTFEYVDRTITSDDFSDFCGVVSSYNSNTFKGRLYLPEAKRTIPFELGDQMRNPAIIDKITSSLAQNATRVLMGHNSSGRDICLEALRNETNSGRLKSLLIVGLGDGST